MSLRRKALPIAIGLVVGATVVPPTVAFAENKIQDVFVTNTAGNPVPVSGSVAVSNQPTVDLAGPVHVQTSPAHPLDVVAPAETFFAATDAVDVADGQVVGSTTVAVPDGMRLIVRTISVGTVVGDDDGIQSVSFFAGQTASSPAIYLPLHLTSSITNSWAATEAVFFATEDPITVSVLRDGTAGFVSVGFSVMGTLVSI